MLIPFSNTAAARRAERRAIREALGTLSTPAPGPIRAARALVPFAGLIHMASGGRLALRIYDTKHNCYFDTTAKAAEWIEKISFVENN